MAKRQFSPWLTALPLGVEYRKIDDFPGYCVGDDGSVWSCWRTKYSRDAGRLVPYQSEQWRRLACVPDAAGYPQVILCRGPKHHKQVKVHKLVLELFVGPRPCGLVSAHENGIPRDVCRTNLRWATQQSNLADRHRHGTSPIGERHWNCRLTAAQVIEMRQLWATGEYTRPQLAARFGVSKYTVTGIISGRAWKHLLNYAPPA